jgi:hypothetical protein
MNVVTFAFAATLFVGLVLGLWCAAGIRLDVIRQRDEEKSW